MNWREKVDRDHLVPLLRSHLIGVAIVGDTRAIHENIESTECLKTGSGTGTDPGRVRQIANLQKHLRAKGFRFARTDPKVGLINIDQEKVGSFSRQRQGDRASESACCACYERLFSSNRLQPRRLAICWISTPE